MDSPKIEYPTKSKTNLCTKKNRNSYIIDKSKKQEEIIWTHLKAEWKNPWKKSNNVSFSINLQKEEAGFEEKGYKIE